MEARAKLAKATVSSRVLACYFLSVDGEKEFLLNTEIQRGAHIENFEVPISFSSGGPVWGKLVFSVEMQGLVRSMREFKSMINLSQSLTGLLLIIATISFIFFLWRSSHYLELRVSDCLNGQFRHDKGSLSIFWSPLLNQLSSVAAQYRSVDLTIRQIEKENESSRMMDLMMHDLKSPLTALKTGIHKIGIENSAVRLMDSATKRIEELVTSSVIHRKLDSNSGACISRIELADFLERLLPDLKCLNSSARIDLVLGKKDEEYFSFVDPDLCSRIIGNLVQNSIEASHGSIFIRILIRKTDSFNYIVISDKGRGMSNEIIEKIGKIPVSSGKHDGKMSGSGQGLYGAFKLVRAWGGEIKVSSELGVGTQIVIALPIAT
tara:strand:+ start:573 stop:1706 length:1134 start_codon:yes stop_codon:yes gene_type:complete